MTSTAVQNLVDIHPWGLRVKYRWNINYISFFIYTPFLTNAPTGHTADHIFTLNGSNDADSRKDVPFLASVDIAAHLGDQIAQKKQFWGCE